MNQSLALNRLNCEVILITLMRFCGHYKINVFHFTKLPIYQLVQFQKPEPYAILTLHRNFC